MAREASDTSLLGAAAEHYVMCQLLRRNMIAALAPVGVRDADIIVSNGSGTAFSAVQVKARREVGTDGGWHMKSKHETIVRPSLFYCFVDFGKTLDDRPKSWVIPSEIVAKVLIETHQAWLAQPGRGGRDHQPTDMRRFLPDFGKRNTHLYPRGWLDQYQDEWRMIAP
jgi:hypothetical protein